MHIAHRPFRIRPVNVQSCGENFSSSSMDSTRRADAKSSVLCNALSLLFCCAVHTCPGCQQQHSWDKARGSFDANSRANATATNVFSGNKSQLHSKSTQHGHTEAIFQLHGNAKKSSKKRRNSRRWLHDSGASVHCCNDISMFHSFYSDDVPKPTLRVANGNLVQVEQMGTVVLNLQNQHGKFDRVLITNVAYTPSFNQNILSVSRLWHENRLSTKFGKRCYLKSDTGSKYLLDTDTSPYTLSANSVFAAQESLKSPGFRLWHEKFMHAGESKMHALAKYIPDLRGYQPCACDACCCHCRSCQTLLTLRCPADGGSRSIQL